MPTTSLIPTPNVVLPKPKLLLSDNLNRISKSNPMLARRSTYANDNHYSYAYPSFLCAAAIQTLTFALALTITIALTLTLLARLTQTNRPTLTLIGL